METIHITKSTIDKTIKEEFSICPLVEVEKSQKKGLCKVADNLVCGLGLMDMEAPEDCPMRKRSVLIEMVIKSDDEGSK
jgi:hypothetical protein